MGPFIQGRMVLPFQLEGLKVSFYPPPEGKHCSWPVWRISHLNSQLHPESSWQEVFTPKTQHKETLALKHSDCTKGRIQLISPAGTQPLQIYAH